MCTACKTVFYTAHYFIACCAVLDLDVHVVVSDVFCQNLLCECQNTPLVLLIIKNKIEKGLRCMQQFYGCFRELLLHTFMEHLIKFQQQGPKPLQLMQEN